MKPTDGVTVGDIGTLISGGPLMTAMRELSSGMWEWGFFGDGGLYYSVSLPASVVNIKTSSSSFHDQLLNDK